jgi:hypothetical protein
VERQPRGEGPLLARAERAPLDPDTARAEPLAEVRIEPGPNATST